MQQKHACVGLHYQRAQEAPRKWAVPSILPQVFLRPFRQVQFGRVENSSSRGLLDGSTAVQVLSPQRQLSSWSP